MTPKGAIDGLGKLLCIHNVPMLHDHGRSNQLARYRIFDMCILWELQCGVPIGQVAHLLHKESKCCFMPCGEEAHSEESRQLG